MTPLQAVIERTQERESWQDQIHLGWHLLREADEEEAVARAREILRGAADQRGGDAGRYHETMIRALLHLIQAGRSALPAAHSFSAFCLMYPEPLREDALALYYSREALLSAEARAGWIDPDLRALPLRAD